MNNTDNNLQRINEILNKGTNGAIVLATNPSHDAMAAATSLYLTLSKLNKNITLACSNENLANPDIMASDKIQTNLVNGGDNLVISFPYTDGAIDKVDYNIQGSNFNLVVTPRQGYPKLEPKQVKYSYTGGNLDFIIVIDAPTLNSLGSLYSENQNLFQGKDIINIDRHLTNASYGTVNLVNKTSSSISEIVFKLIQNLQIEIDRDISTNLYYGISASTNNFTSYSVNASTFETIATLLRMGALKKTYKKSGQTIQSNQQMNSFPTSTFPPQTGFNRSAFSYPSNQPTQIQQPSHESRNVKPIQSVEKEKQVGETPQDWLKPKIFRGNDLI